MGRFPGGTGITGATLFRNIIGATRNVCEADHPVTCVWAGIPFRRSRAVPRFPLSTSECNVYRVAIFRAQCPFRRHELAVPCSTEHPGFETLQWPQLGRTCSSGPCEPRPCRQGRERQVRGLPRPSRTLRQGAQCRVRGALHKTLANIYQPLMRSGRERLKR